MVCGRWLTRTQRQEFDCCRPSTSAPDVRAGWSRYAADASAAIGLAVNGQPTCLRVALADRRRNRERRRPSRCLIVDDSAIVRKLLADALQGEPDIEVVGGAADPFIARDMILQLEPDVITLDIEMPRMDGLSFLRKLMEHQPMPVIIISSLTQQGSAATIEALRAGAIDVIAKPGGPARSARSPSASSGACAHPRCRAGRLARAAAPAQTAPDRHHVVRFSAAPATGSSPSARPPAARRRSRRVLTRMPADVAADRHRAAHAGRLHPERSPSGSTRRLPDARRRGRRRRTARARRRLRRARRSSPGRRRCVGIQLLTALHDGPPVHYQRPAVDVLFHSLARLRGVPMVALLLTGMGADGADGHGGAAQARRRDDRRGRALVRRVRHAAEAIARGGAMHVATLLRIPTLIPECFNRAA